MSSVDAEWLEYDDDRRHLVTANGVRHIGRGMRAACGAGPLVYVLRPADEIEFRCPQCFGAGQDKQGTTCEQ